MRIMVTGAGGNVGRALVDELKSRGHEVTGTAHRQLEITDSRAVMQHIDILRPELIIHCAAMTHVDRCAELPEEALRINAMSVQNFALACRQYNAALCLVSTNEVFDGEGTRPYMEYDHANPVNPYGYSKWVGEKLLRDLLPAHYIARTSWMFAHGGSNFLQKILAAVAAGRPVSVVTDETASPTYVDDFVVALAALVESGRYGTYHLTNEGECSRYEFARHILDVHGYTDYPITPISKADFKRPSQPPTYSPLKNFFAAQAGISLRSWREAVHAFAEKEKMLTKV